MDLFWLLIWQICAANICFSLSLRSGHCAQHVLLVAVIQALVAQENLGELGQAMERVTILGQQVEKLCAEVRERDAAIKFRDTQLTTLQNAADQRKRALDEEAEKLHREKVRRVRLEEEVKVELLLDRLFSAILMLMR